MSFLSKWFRRSSPASSRRGHRSRGFRPRLESLEERLVLDVSLSLVVPPSSSYGVTNTLLIEYTNTGTSVVPAPVLIVSADNANLWLPTAPEVIDFHLQVLATGPSGPAGTK